MEKPFIVLTARCKASNPETSASADSSYPLQRCKWHLRFRSFVEGERSWGFPRKVSLKLFLNYFVSSHYFLCLSFQSLQYILPRSRSCFSPSDVSNFIRLGANQCGANQAQGVWAAGFKGGDDDVAGVPYTAFGLVNLEEPGVLSVP